jgi:hypothetical protein
MAKAGPKSAQRPPRFTATESEWQTHARQAFRAYIGNVTIFFAYPGGPGTGTVFRTNAGEQVVLTARHVAEKLSGTFHVGSTLLTKSVDAVATDIQFAPPRPASLSVPPCENAVDVAAVRLTLATGSQLSIGFCSPDQLGQDDDVAATDVVPIAGFASFLAFTSDHPPKRTELTNIIYTTGFDGRDSCGRLRVNWNEALVDPGAPEHPRFKALPNKPTKLGEPYGISGGGLWRIRGTPSKAEIWTPARTGQGDLLGVASAWDNKKTEFVEPTSLWAEWFAELLAKA